MGGCNSKVVPTIDTSYQNFMICASAIICRTLTYKQKLDIIEYLKLLGPVEPTDSVAISELISQYKSQEILSYFVYIDTMLIFKTHYSTLQHKFLNDSIHKYDLDTLKEIDNNPYF